MDAADVVPTLEQANNVRVSLRFFETDYRTTNRFSLVPGKDAVTFTGETNWMSASAFRGASESCAAFSSLITGMMGGNKRVSTPSPETASIFGTSSSSY